MCGSNVNNGMVGFLVPVNNCCGWGNRILASDGCRVERLGTSGNQLENLKEKKTRENTHFKKFVYNYQLFVCLHTWVVTGTAPETTTSLTVLVAPKVNRSSPKSSYTPRLCKKKNHKIY